MIRPSRLVPTTACLLGLACSWGAGGCGGPSGGESDAVAKQNIDDELKAMENAKLPTKGRKAAAGP